MKCLKILFLLVTSFACFARAVEPAKKINPDVLKDSQPSAEETKKEEGKPLDLEGLAEPTKKQKPLSKRRIQPNSGQCAPGETPVMGDAGVEDFRCTSPAPLGPDYKDRKQSN